MSNNKQSSVEWLFDELARINFEYATNKITPRDFQEQKEKIKQQVKARHKEEIEDAWDKGDYCIDLPDGTWEQKYKSAEHYYNEKFGGQDA